MTEIEKSRCSDEWLGLEKRLQDGGSEVLWREYNHCAVGLDRLGSGLAFARKVAGHNKTLEAPHRIAGNLLLAAGQWQEGTAEFEQAYRLAPHKADSLENLCRAYLLMQKRESVIALCLDALHNNPEDLVNFQMLVAAYFLVRDTDKMGEIAEQGLLKFPNDPTLHSFFGNSLAVQGKFNEAKAQFEKALEINPQSGDALNGLGQTWLYLHHPEEAERVAARLKSVDPKAAEAIQTNAEKLKKALAKRYYRLRCAAFGARR